jgi:hypothetical protein
MPTEGAEPVVAAHARRVLIVGAGGDPFAERLHGPSNTCVKTLRN